MYDYIDALDDAAQKRDPKHYEYSRGMASCIIDIIKILKQYKIKDVDKTVHILTSVLVIPIQILEQDPAQRSILMRQLATKFLQDILSTQLKDDMIRDTEVGNELDKMRTYAGESETFFGNPQKRT